MKRLFKILLFLTIITFLSGCGVRQMDVIDFKSGTTLRGEYDDFEQTAKVIMPSGEVLTGHVTEIRESINSFTNELGTGKNKNNNNLSTTTTTSNVYVAQGILKSNTSNLIMDLNLTLTNMGGGYGTAKANDGKEYKVQLKD